MSSPTHPARSLDFLSRLHDGELAAAERAHFESHRAHCAECRRAAADFEDALAVYRTAGTSPPPSDLAARILRRLESSNRRRSPFGVVFGIDLRWAGAFTAALIAVIFGYSVLDRREASRRIPISFAQPTPGASAILLDKAEAPLPAATAQAPAARHDAKAAPPAAVQSVPAEPAAANEGRASSPAPAAPTDPMAPTAAAPNPPLESSPPPAAKSSRALARAKEEDSAAARNSLSKGRAAGRAVITALDGEGAAPALLNAPAVTFQPGDFGSYILAVGADGVPVEVAALDEAGKEKKADLDRSTGEALRKLRFQPGAGPRRLLVSVEPEP